jgi:hypothetical protein
MTENPMPQHPGKIVYVDGNTGEVTEEVDAAEVPVSIRFVELEGRVVPVVKIVSYTQDNRRVVEQLGPDDEFLRSTLMLSD